MRVKGKDECKTGLESGKGRQGYNKGRRIVEGATEWNLIVYCPDYTAIFFDNMIIQANVTT